jgi:hypothetical protein
MDEKIHARKEARRHVYGTSSIIFGNHSEESELSTFFSGSIILMEILMENDVLIKNLPLGLWPRAHHPFFPCPFQQKDAAEFHISTLFQDSCHQKWVNNIRIYLFLDKL